MEEEKAMGVPDIGRVGVWAMDMRFGEHAAIDEAAVELEELGYGALWIPGGIDDQVLTDFDRLLAKTSRIVLASGIVNIWKQSPEEVAAWWKGLSADKQARVWLGIGVSHGPIIGESWGKPVEVTRDWVAKATAAGLPADAMCIAALGPKMLELARDATGGAHPYLVTPEHTAIARKVLGQGKVLAPEQGVVLESDPAKARELARGALGFYTTLPNYVNNWKRLGFSQEDAATSSDKLIDGLFAWGGPAEIAARVKAHHDAGADHVCIQVVSATGLEGSRHAWRELAKVLL
jgi:probable F420-dependent oxidoreductase